MSRGRTPAKPPEPQPQPDFDSATAYACSLMGRGNVVCICGDVGGQLVARGYLSFDEARKLRDKLTEVIGT